MAELITARARATSMPMTDGMCGAPDSMAVMVDRNRSTSLCHGPRRGSDHSFVRYVHLVAWHRLPGIFLLDPSLSVGPNPMLLWSTLVVNLQAALLPDLLLTMSIPGRNSTAATLVRTGFVVVLVLVNVSGFRPVLARGWHGVRSCRQGGRSPQGLYLAATRAAQS
jgi:hypothetical protein